MLTAPSPEVVADDPPPPPPSPARRTWRPSNEHIAFIVFGALVVLAVFANHWSEFAPDTKPELYLNPGGLLQTSLSSWAQNPYQAGRPNFNTGLAPVAAALWLIEVPGTPPWLAMRFWRAGLMLFAAWGIVRFYRRLTPTHGNAVGRVAVAVAYVVNPFVIIGGGTTPILLPYAVLPWMLLAFARAVEEPRNWRWPALFALAFFAMSGIQAGVVPIFLMSSVPCYLVYRRVVFKDPWGTLVRATLSCAVLTVAVSVYWLIPSFFARNTGDAVAAESEDPALIALTSSWAESLRLLGQWPMYGRLGDRLFLPKGIRYVVDPFVVVASFAYPILAAIGAIVSRARARLLAVLFIVVAVPIMVGMFPPKAPTPLGRLFSFLFADVPGAVAFRTTHKIAPVALLGFSLLIGFGAAALAPKFATWPRPVVIGAAVLTLLVLVGGTIPAWTNDLYRDGWEVPGYWQQAADDLNAGSPDSRVLIVPGAKGGQYRWGLRSPDDLFPSIMERPNVSRQTVSAGAVFPANYLAALDIPLNTGRATGPTVSTMAHYLGATQVLARNDTEWEIVGGARPSVVRDQLKSDPGLTPSTVYGDVAQNTMRATTGDANLARAAQDKTLTPLALYDVNQPTSIVRAEPTAGQYVIDGDNFAVPVLAQLGMMGNLPTFQLAGSLTPATLGQAIDDGGQLVITDTNRRRLYSVQRINDSYTETLSAGGSTSGQTATSATLWPNRPETQTISRLDGAASITTSNAGQEFGLSAFGQPEAAFDGDPASSWIISSFGGGKGESVTVQYSQPETPRTVTIQTLVSKPVAISALTVSTDKSSTVVQVPPDGKVTLCAPPDLDSTGKVCSTLPNEPTTSLRVGVAQLRGSGTNIVGISEIAIDGVTPTTTMVMPTTLSNLTSQLSPEQRAKLAAAPLHVIMKRQVSTPGDLQKEEERAIHRVFKTPVDHDYTAKAGLSVNEVPSATAQQVMQDAKQNQDPCFQVGDLDGRPVRMKLTSPLDSAVAGQGGILETCEPVRLAAGEHTFNSAPGWPLDVIHYRAGPPAAAANGGGVAPAPAQIEVRTDTDTELAVHTSSSDTPYLLTTGRGFDRRWVGTIDGKPLGEPALVDGYAVGWRIDQPGEHDIVVRFFPQRPTTYGLWFGAFALLGCIGLAAIPNSMRPSRRRGARRRPSAGPAS
jgi:arabinofuranan 3-O-arabinosyltransferase